MTLNTAAMEFSSVELPCCKAACHQFGLTTPVQILGNRKFTPDLLEGESTKTKKSSGGKGRPGEGC
uniref:Uncharacterized protein n=1 Tax=Oryza punctata TaxID=4537 RepID=A0A0E0JXT6_ORYPU